MMQKNRKLLIIMIGLCAISIGLWSCQWHTIEPIAIQLPDPGDPNNPVDSVSFATEVFPIFDAKCSSCHPTLHAPDFSSVSNAHTSLTENSYVDTDTPANSLVITKITSGDHNATSYTTAEQTSILTWITQGAKNN